MYCMQHCEGTQTEVTNMFLYQNTPGEWNAGTDKTNHHYEAVAYRPIANAEAINEWG